MKDSITFLIAGLLFIIISYGFVRLVIALIRRSGQKLRDEINAALAKAIPATATIIEIQQPKVALRKPRMGSVHVLLTLNVIPSTGASAYTATVQWQVEQSALQNAQSGQSVAVKIDANNAQKIYPDASWANYNWNQGTVT